MEMSDKKQDTSVNRQSSWPSKCILCQPCSADGEDLDADGFCHNCQEYLCTTCIRHHRKATLSKHHDILDKDEMPRNGVQQTARERCPVYLTPKVKEVSPVYEYDVSRCRCHYNYTTEEHELPLCKLEQLQSSVKSMKKDLERSEREAAMAYDTAIRDIRNFRKEVEVYLEQMERCVIAKCDSLKKENEEAIKNIGDTLNSLKTELDGIFGRLISHFIQSGDMFVQAERINICLHQLKKDMITESEYAVKCFTFERNKDVEGIVSKKSPLGKLVSQTSRIQSLECTEMVAFEPLHTCEINVKSSSDTQNALISSMTMVSQDTILCVDCNNQSVKVVDTNNGCLCSSICFTSGPWDITSISKDQVAVTLPDDRQIAFISFEEKELSVSRNMKVGGLCRGIAYNRNTLIVSYEDSKIEILNLSGNVLQTFKAGNKSGSSVSWPGCVDVGIRGDCMFVSALQSDCVFKMTFDGRLLGTYTDANLLSPRALTVLRDGSVLVCSSEGHSVHMISQDCVKVKYLLTGDNAKYVHSVCYNEDTATLYTCNFDYISEVNNNVIHVYRNTPRRVRLTCYKLV